MEGGGAGIGHAHSVPGGKGRQKRRDRSMAFQPSATVRNLGLVTDVTPSLRL